MKCLSCKNGEMKEAIYNHFVDLDPFFLIIRGVPCNECSQCGERVITDDTMRQIEAFTDPLKPLHNATAVTIVDYLDILA